MKITRLELYELCKKQELNLRKTYIQINLESIRNEILNKNFSELTVSQTKQLDNVLYYFFYQLQKKLENVSYQKKRFEEKNSEWLANEIDLFEVNSANVFTSQTNSPISKKSNKLKFLF